MNRITYKNDMLHLGTFTPNEDYKLVGKYKGLYIWVDDNEGKFLQMEVCTDNNSLSYLFGIGQGQDYLKIHTKSQWLRLMGDIKDLDYQQRFIVT